MNLEKVFDKTRHELLDMGLRGNTLLHLPQSLRTLELKDIDLQSLIEEWVVQRQDYPFFSSTQFSEEELTQRLFKIHAEATAYTQEKGADLLYLAVGFLTWYENEKKEFPRSAPLILIPIELCRHHVRSNFILRYTGGEIKINSTLAAKLKVDFGLYLPHFEQNIDEDASLIFDEITNYFQKVEMLIAQEASWCVEKEKMVLSLFYFGKYQMYQDLSHQNWPKGKKPFEHSLIQKLFVTGFEHDAALISQIHLAEKDHDSLHLVLDSDSSQTEAVLCAKSGASFVIQGPPGTGKSQTITNIIAQSLADNKKVLFVAEKMAALEVVKRRLIQCHLGDAVLELHSQKDNSKLFLHSLQKTLMQDVPVVPNRTYERNQLSQLRLELANYQKAIHTPIAEMEMNYQTAIGYAFQYEDELKKADIDPNIFPILKIELNDWNQTVFRHACCLIKEMAAYLDAHPSPCLNVFSSTKLHEHSPAIDKQAAQLVHQLQIQQSQIIAQATKYIQEFDLHHALTTYQDYQGVIQTIAFILSRPQSDWTFLSFEQWQRLSPGLMQVTNQAIDLNNEKMALEVDFMDAAFSQDWIKQRGSLLNMDSKWWRFFSPSYQAAKNKYKNMRRQACVGHPLDWVEHMDRLLTYQAKVQRHKQNVSCFEHLLGHSENDVLVDWHTRLAFLQWQSKCQQGLADGSIHPIFRSFLESNQQLPIEVEAFNALLKQIEERDKLVRRVIRLLKLDAKIFQKRMADLTLNTLSKLAADIQELYVLTRFNRISKDLNTLELKTWATFCSVWQGPTEYLEKGFLYRFYEWVANEKYQHCAEIRHFDRIAHEDKMDAFRHLDHQLSYFNQESLVLKLNQALPRSRVCAEMDILRREMNKKRRHLSIRQLIQSTGRAIQEIKPVLMMSPMSVATYLDPSAIEFDLVIFDEASQIKVPDAVGAILRAKQVIVVGDTQQMPPSQFFSKQFDESDFEENITADIESILSLFLARGAPEHLLTWHYRSRHQSLIALSNQFFYQNHLNVFPTSGFHSESQGLQLTILKETIYDRGGTRTNLGEALAIAEAVMQHAKMYPQQSIGIVAFSTAQRHAIFTEIERMKSSHLACESLFESHPTGEDFFVKNLENVQGDERDTIFISIGYGKDRAGEFVMNFGPLNHFGGERRFNVLMTRARMNMRVFCNFDADELITTEDTAKGVQVLKTFLKYAQTHQLNRQSALLNPSQSCPMKLDLMQTIQSFGYLVQTEFDLGSQPVDLAVCDPADPNKYLLGIQIEMGSMARSKHIRDELRLRPMLLSNLGWQIERCWSTDWFRQRSQEISRIMALIEAACDGHIPKHKCSMALQHSIERQKSFQDSEAMPYITLNPKCLNIHRSMQINEIPIEIYISDIELILQQESPLHKKQICFRLLAAMGKQRANVRITRMLDEALAELEKNKRIQVIDDFVLLTAQISYPIRNRNQLPNNERKFEYIYDGEIQAALLYITKQSKLLTSNEIIKATTEIFGFMVASQLMRIRIQMLIDQSILYNDLNTHMDE